jgi:hypothetical protein
MIAVSDRKKKMWEIEGQVWKINITVYLEGNKCGPQ